jgi:hypothetical protein
MYEEARVRNLEAVRVARHGVRFAEALLRRDVSPQIIAELGPCRSAFSTVHLPSEYMSPTNWGTSGVWCKADCRLRPLASGMFPAPSYSL